MLQVLLLLLGRCVLSQGRLVPRGTRGTAVGKGEGPQMGGQMGDKQGSGPSNFHTWTTDFLTLTTNVLTWTARLQRGRRSSLAVGCCWKLQHAYGPARGWWEFWGSWSILAGAPRGVPRPVPRDQGQLPEGRQHAAENGERKMPDCGGGSLACFRLTPDLFIVHLPLIH